jgi:hypothetical protein
MRRSSSLVVVAAARFDGKAYPYVFRGAAAASTINLTRVDDRTFKFIVLADGKASFAGTHALSADGKSVTQTFTANGKGEPSSAVLLYERQ